jgi:DNA (cytosine-5)-methyltransferase 1
MKLRGRSEQVISLFSGAGGFSYGFSMAGLRPTIGAEIDADACATYEENISSTCLKIDLSVASSASFSKAVNGSQPFAVIGGPPCQGFSSAGARNASDPRNELIFNYLRIVRELQPRWFIFENVEGLLTSEWGADVTSLVRAFLEIGYSVRLQKINVAAYGVPQTRKRVLIVGNNLGLDFEFPEETHSFDSGKSKKRSPKPFAPTLNEAIAGLGVASTSRKVPVQYLNSCPCGEYDTAMRKGNLSGLINEHFHSTTLEDSHRYSLLAPGHTMKDLPEHLWHESFKRRAYRRVKDGTPTEKRGGAPSGIKRLFGNLQSLTITGAASREFIHPTENRPLTIRECARIQSFPDQYLFVGNAASVAQQIGNAVPPMAASVFAKHLLKLDGSFGSGLQTSHQLRAPRLLGFVLTESNGMSEALQKTEARLLSLIQQDLAFS